MNIAIIAFVCVVGGGLLGILGSFYLKQLASKVKEEEKSTCLDFFYKREKEI